MFLEKVTSYDGSFIHKRFAYEYFRKDTLRSGNIVSFIGPMEVTTNLIDLEDSLEKDYIYSEKAINFCWEIPDIDLFGGVAFQRLFNTAIANLLHGYIKAPIEMKGDDIIVHKEHNQGGITQLKGKASVSIATHKNNAVIGHTGINITAGKKAPAFAYSTNLTDEQARQFIADVEKTFYEMTDSIFLATTKVI
jgi:hypothetical protein